VSENEVLKKIYDNMRQKVTGSWRTLQNKERYKWYSTPNIISIIK